MKRRHVVSRRNQRLLSDIAVALLTVGVLVAACAKGNDSGVTSSDIAQSGAAHPSAVRSAGSPPTAGQPGGPAPAPGLATARNAGPPKEHFDMPDWKPPAEAEIPKDSLGASISRGLALVNHTSDSLPRFDVGSLQCTSCHIDNGTKFDAAPLTGAQARFPKYMDRTGAVIPIADRVNYCFTRSLGGYKIPTDSREMQDISAYLAFISKGVPVGSHIAGSAGLLAMPHKLVGDASHGSQIFASTCTTCHGAQGQGGPAIPPLWGPKSYSIGASMAREERAASFIWHNMPLSAPGTLTEQQAFDVSAYINSMPRPDSPGKEKDWPAGGTPYDVPYNTADHKAYRPPPHLFSRPNPQRAIVPPPAQIARAINAASK